MAVHSARSNFGLRDAARRGYLRACAGDDYGRLFRCDYLFILGKTEGEEEEEEVLREANAFGDVLVEDFVDAYNNLTLKSLFMLKFFLEGKEAKQCYTHLFKE